MAAHTPRVLSQMMALNYGESSKIGAAVVRREGLALYDIGGTRMTTREVLDLISGMRSYVLRALRDASLRLKQDHIAGKYGLNFGWTSDGRIKIAITVEVPSPRLERDRATAIETTVDACRALHLGASPAPYGVTILGCHQPKREP
jgi:hypothetical protein